MKKTNYHTHTIFSDGDETVEKIVSQAIKTGFDTIGFSDHSPVPFECYWNMKYENLLTYINTVNDCKNKFENQINIYCGIEADYIENVTDFRMYEKFNLDYIIGGIHFLPSKFQDGKIFNIDDNEELFNKGLVEIFGNDIKKLIKSYYNAVNKMLSDKAPDIIAHLDLVEKFNKNFKYFNSADKWYQDIVKETLQIISESNSVIEINCRSKYKVLLNDFSPKTWIIQETKKLNIPLTISGDVHNSQELDLFWNDAVKSLNELKINEIIYFENKKPIFQKI